MRWAGWYDLAFDDWSLCPIRRQDTKSILALGASVTCGALSANNLVRSAKQAADAFDVRSSGSSGETGLAHVRESLQRGPQVLMFDACAAHLDEANSTETDRLLNEAARQRTIVDIRHR